ncbi:hypothetical protein MTO96_019680 [Rhipicephalus appendiculatus]
MCFLLEHALPLKLKILTLLFAEKSRVVERSAKAIAIVQTIGTKTMAEAIVANTIPKSADAVAVDWVILVCGMFDSSQGWCVVNSGS